MLCRQPRPVGNITAPSTQDRLQLIRDTCAKQLQNPLGDPHIRFRTVPGLTPDQYNTDPFTPDELQYSLNKMRNHRAPGPDGIRNEYLKVIGGSLLPLMNAMLAGATPSTVKQTVLAMIPKCNGNLSTPKGWRFIALLNTIVKLFNRMLLERIRPRALPRMRPNQCGFLPRRSTLQQIIALKLLVQDFNFFKHFGGEAHGVRSLVLTFIDFSNAFPSVSWPAIRAALRAFSVPTLLVDAIMNIYTDHTAWVRTPEGDTPTFQPTAGVLQGDTLAPFLFDLVVDCILHKCYADLASIKPGIPLRHGSLTDLDYADDIALISRGMGEAQITLLHCQAIALSAGLEMNASKTKYIVLGRDRQRPPLQLNNAPLEAVTDFRYLGSYLDDDADFTARRGQAWEIVNRCKPVWNSPCVSRENKRRLFRTLVEPILLYSAPSYSMTDGRARRLDGCCTRMLKIVQNYIPTDHIPLATIYEDLPLLSSSCILRQLRAVLSTFASLPDHPLCELLLHPLGHTLVAARRWTLRATISANWSLPLTDIPMYAHGAFEDFISSRAYAHEVQTRRNVMYRSTRKSLSKDFACIVQQNAPSLSGDEDTPLNATPLASIRGLPRLEQQVAFLASIRPDLISLSFLTPLNLHKSSPTPDIRPLTPPAATSAASVTVTISATRATRPPEASDTISPLTAVSITSDSMLVASKSYTICAQTQDAAAIATCEILSEFPLVSFTFATSFKMFPKHRRMYRRQNRKHIVWKSLYRLILDRDATLIHTTFIQAPRPPRPRREESESA